MCDSFTFLCIAFIYVSSPALPRSPSPALPRSPAPPLPRSRSPALLLSPSPAPPFPPSSRLVTWSRCTIPATDVISFRFQAAARHSSARL